MRSTASARALAFASSKASSRRSRDFSGTGDVDGRKGDVGGGDPKASGDVGGGSDRDRDASLNSDRADLGMIGGGESLRGPPPPSPPPVPPPIY